MPSTTLTDELTAAVAAVRAAARVCRAVQERLISPETIEKKDKSPVTVADYASQAVVCAALAEMLPDDRVVGEEAADALREQANAAVRAVVTEQVAAARGEAVSEQQVLAWIDRGGAPATGGRYWTLDPIDGTKGFLRKQQYAVALGLIENGAVVLGVLGCPNLPADTNELASGTGVLFTAVRGQGARQYSLDDDDDAGLPVAVTAIAGPAEACLCESVESGHSDQSSSARIAELLGITREPFRIDSQCKYAAVARGDAQIYLRLPTRADYEEKIWDHAAGKIVVEEAGGRVSDITGAPLDFSQGRTLKRNKGVIATCGTIHDEVVKAVQSVLG